MEKVQLTVCALLFSFVAIVHFSPVSAGDGGIEKPGSCPPLSFYGIARPCQYNPWGSCSSDFQCPGNEKCCNNGCGNVCVDPYTAPVEKPGVCPRRTYVDQASCYRYSQYRCTCDQDCPGKFKCCNFGCGLVCVRPVPVEKPGVCPRRTHVDWKFCSRFTPNNCTCDQECPGKLKCCDFGCGPTCVKPVTVPVDKPGVCPRPTHVDWRFCSRFTSNNCTCDQECPGKLKCCNFGCGPTCVKPVTVPVEKPGVCPRRTNVDWNYCERYSQSKCTCDQDCPGKLKCCDFGCGPTCVKPATVEKPGVCPRRTHIDWRYCASYSQSRCTCDEECPGKLKCCDFGCGPTCVEPATVDNPGVCPPPVYSDPAWCAAVTQIKCTCDQDCGKNLKCCNNGCGPTCVKPIPAENPGTCPPPIYRHLGWCARIYQLRCTCDQDCGKKLKCCNNGCGPTCVEPILVKPGVCPRPSGFGICIQECNNDFECQADQKCCSNGCGNVCTGPLRGY